MKKLYPIFLFVAMSFIGCTPKEDVFFNDKSKKLTGDVKTDVNNLLPAGKVTVEIMDGIKRDMRLAELQTKYQKGAREHYEWYVEYIKNYKVGKPIPYHENFGLTPEEYKERQERIDKITYYSTGLDEIEIVKKDGIISFNTGKKLKEFRNVTFNLKNNTATIGDYTLHFADTLNIDNKINPFKSKFKGYVWSFENPKDMHLDALKDLYGLNVVQYKITLAQLEDGRTLFSIKATEVQEGIILLELDLPILI